MEEKRQSPYEWCLEYNVRPLSVKTYSQSHYFMQSCLNEAEFKEYMSKENYKTDSTPRKPEMYLELKMYGFVPYNLSPIQQGIQFGHAVDQYKVLFGHDSDFQNYLNEWKTYMIYNGGTSNEGHMVRHGFKDMWYVGTMQEHLKTLLENGVKVAKFYEPDLNSMLTAVVFLVDERVFNKELYPDYVQTPYPNGTLGDPILEARNYNAWVEKIGGPKNAFLREYLKGRKFAG